MHQLDVAIPLQLKSQLRKGGSGQPCIGEGDTDISDTMQFVMLTRKGNKQQVTGAKDTLEHKQAKYCSTATACISLCTTS